MAIKRSEQFAEIWYVAVKLGIDSTLAKKALHLSLHITRLTHLHKNLLFGVALSSITFTKSAGDLVAAFASALPASPVLLSLNLMSQLLLASNFSLSLPKIEDAHHLALR
jgi:hypothetical protein